MKPYEKFEPFKQEIVLSLEETLPSIEEEVEEMIMAQHGRLSKEFIDIVILVESEGNHRAVSWAGFEKGAGKMQISDIARREYNNRNGTSYTQHDLFNPEINVMIGCWLLNDYAQQLGDLTYEQLYVAYNVGIGNYIKYYNSHYSKGLMPNGGKYTSLDRYNRIKQEYNEGAWNKLLQS
jgi:soluble lytic murein transglycosylase-like protein